MQWLKSIFTDDDWDTDAVLCVLVVCAMFTCYAQYKNLPTFDPEKFGQGIGYLLGGGGLGYCAKRYAEKRGIRDADSTDSTVSKE